jgi:hypothetical protein
VEQREVGKEAELRRGGGDPVISLWFRSIPVTARSPRWRRPRETAEEGSEAQKTLV